MEPNYLYAPCDGEIQEISELNDGVFSEKMLGDGFYIIPESNILSSPIKEGWLESIFFTKHAYSFKTNSGLLVLMHIGMETVKLNGNFFEVLIDEKVNVTYETEIVKVDFEGLKKENISIATPIVIENLEEKKLKLEIKKTGKVKKGDIIAEFIDLELSEIVKSNSEETSENKFEAIAKNIETAVGTIANVEKVYNCMTRFRMILKDKTKVDEKEILKIRIVKGINWSGNELQIIIGGQVNLVKDGWTKKFSNQESKNSSNNIAKNKMPFKEKALRTVSGIVQPIVPVIITGGLLTSLYAILELFGALQAISLSYDVTEGVKFINEYNIFSGIMFMICKIGLGFLGLLFCFNTVKFFGGDQIIGIFLGLILTAPYLFSGLSWTLFKISEFEVKIEGYTNSVLPQIGGAIIYLMLSKWIKKWMPQVVDNLFRNTLAIFITSLVTFLIVGPVLKTIESGAFFIIKYAEGLQFGLGTLIFSILWLPLVVTGMHMGVVALIMAGVENGPSAFYWINANSAVGCIGISVAMFILSKKNQVKDVAITSFCTSMLGISEPSIYGILIARPKMWIPYFAGQCTFGLLIGILGVKAYTVGGGGVISFTNLVYKDVPISNLIFGIIAWVSGLSIGFVVALFVYEEKPTEKKLTKKANDQLLKFIKRKNQMIQTEFKNYLNEIEQFVIKEKNNFTESYNAFILYNNLIDKKEKLEERLEEQINILKLKNTKYINKNNLKKVITIEKNKYYIKIKNLIVKNDKALLLAEKEKEKFAEILDKIQNEYLQKVNAILNDLSSKLKYNGIKDFEANYYNAIQITNIYLGFADKKSEDLKLKKIN